MFETALLITDLQGSDDEMTGELDAGGCRRSKRRPLAEPAEHQNVGYADPITGQSSSFDRTDTMRLPTMEDSRLTFGQASGHDGIRNVRIRQLLMTAGRDKDCR